MDCIYGKKYLQTLDYIDGEKIGILGGSYGGPDEGHGFVKKENEIKGYGAVLEFLERYLKGATATAQ